ncbi:hypothetical protein B296_00002412 [Ensete ventricosum]|uniref:Uncharacterized protein n=1 Tax=Ensete ventricosum TaxID=4639 RepID=A0A427B8L4_ENSVE|nr:hypothetical protein B296_00002412 [Ensete ventricosum]
MEMIISSLVASSGLCPNRVGRPKDPLVSDLEENPWDWFISCTVDGGRSIKDQKNQEGRSAIKNAWIASNGCALSIPRTRLRISQQIERGAHRSPALARGAMQ